MINRIIILALLVLLLGCTESAVLTTPQTNSGPPVYNDIVTANINVNYANDLISLGETVVFSSSVADVTFNVGTATVSTATAPSSWSGGSTVTLSTLGTVKVFCKISKSGMTDEVCAIIYNVVTSFPGVVDTADTRAVYKDDLSIRAWASGASNVVYGTASDSNGVATTWQIVSKALNKAVGDSYDIVCLGDGGQITLTFDTLITDGVGPDFVIFENSFNDTYLDVGYVEVSSDGVNFVRFDSACKLTTPVNSFGAVDITKLYGVAGRYRQGYGTPFNLGWLRHKPEVKNGTVDLNSIRYVRIVDVKGKEVTTPYGGYTHDFDSFNNIMIDPYGCIDSPGFDLDAVGVINQRL